MDGGVKSAGTICTNHGRCESECRSDQDCPRAAFCATSCGVCLYGDLRLATCFVATLGRDQVLGACRQSDLAAGRARVANIEAPEQIPECPGRPGGPLSWPDVWRVEGPDAVVGNDIASEASTREVGIPDTSVPDRASVPLDSASVVKDGGIVDAD